MYSEDNYLFDEDDNVDDDGNTDNNITIVWGPV